MTYRVLDDFSIEKKVPLELIEANWLIKIKLLEHMELMLAIGGPVA